MTSTRLGRYELIARIAAGGMGEIFLARMEGAAGFEKLYAIKRILPHLADSEGFRQMLIDEARVASRMSHANVCHVYELGETDGQLYIVMEYLEGSTLLPLLRKRSKDAAPLELGFIAGVLQQTAEGLHYAHELKDRSGESLGIVHRDVTPSNLFVTEAGVVKVLDFGIAKVKRASKQTQTGTVKGKYAYMSPEQLRGHAVDRQSDVFALGVVAYEMLALRRLFQRKTDYLTFRAVMEQPIIDVRYYRPDCPEPLVNVLLHALERDPDKRFATARQMGAAVVEAIRTVCQPWSQAELSEFISTQFSDELRRRSQQIATVVATGVGLAVPAFGAEAEGATTVDGEDDDYEFPEVDSAIGDTPSDAPHLRGQTGEREQFRVPTAEIEARRAAAALEASPGHATSVARPETLRGVAKPAPQPAAGLATAATVVGVPGVPEPAPAVMNAPPPPALGTSPTQQQPIIVMQRRSLVWPVVACAMIAVAAGALFLVWQQTQRAPAPALQLGAGPGEQIRVDDAGVIIVSREPPTSAAQPVTEPTDKATPDQPTPGPTVPPPRKTPRPVNPYERVIAPKSSAIQRCIVDHGEPPPTTMLRLEVAPDGHLRDAIFDPASVAATPLGACIKDVFSGVVFPHADKDISVPVKISHRA